LRPSARFSIKHYLSKKKKKLRKESDFIKRMKNGTTVLTILPYLGLENEQEKMKQKKQNEV
jgi:hypothetical protein